MADERAGIYSAILNAALNLKQLDSVSINGNHDIATVRPGGALDLGFAGLASSDPFVDLTTGDLGTVLGTVDIATGYNCSSGATFQHQLRNAGGTFKTGANNVTAASTNGFAYVTNISATAGGKAQMSLRYHAHWGGTLTTEPLTWSTGQSLSQTPAFTNVYYAGAVALNGALYEGVTAQSVDPGIVYSSRLQTDDVWPQEGSIVARAPVITLSISKVSRLAEASEAFFGSSLAGTLDVYFWQGVAGGSRVAKATASHIKISCTTGSQFADSVSVVGESDTDVTYRIVPTTTLSASTSSAIGV